VQVTKLKRELKTIRPKVKGYKPDFRFQILDFRFSNFGFCVFCFLVWFGSVACGASTETLFGDASQKKSRARVAAVYFSDGKVLTGKISLTPGRSFKLNIPKAGKLKTKDMVTGEDVQYGKVRRFTFGPVRAIRFYPEK